MRHLATDHRWKLSPTRSERDYTIRIQIPEFTCLCPKTGQPDFATLELEYVPDRLCVELKSLKLYIWSFRDRGAFHEAVTNEIADHIAEATRPRFLRLTRPVQCARRHLHDGRRRAATAGLDPAPACRTTAVDRQRPQTSPRRWRASHGGTVCRTLYTPGSAGIIPRPSRGTRFDEERLMPAKKPAPKAAKGKKAASRPAVRKPRRPASLPNESRRRTGTCAQSAVAAPKKAVHPTSQPYCYGRNDRDAQGWHQPAPEAAPRRRSSERSKPDSGPARARLHAHAAADNDDSDTAEPEACSPAHATYSRTSPSAASCT